MRQKSVGTGSAAAAGRLVALLSASFIWSRARVDPDLWGHLRFGLDALASRHLSTIDPYSFTQDVPWINHEWLSEVAFAVAYRGGGVLGLVLLKAVVLSAAFALLAAAVRGVDDRRRWWLLATGIIGVAPAAFTIRPQLWTLLAVALLSYALNHRRWLPVIPVLFAVWANLHGGWIVGMGIGALWLVGRVIDRRASAVPLAEAIALMAAALATLLNPYGWRLWAFLLSTVRPSRNISEWRPLWQQEDVSAALIWIAIGLVIVMPTLVRRRSALTWADALPVAWLAIMSVFVARLVPLFGEVALLGFGAAWRTTERSGTDWKSPAERVSAAFEGLKASATKSHLVVEAVALSAICLVNLVPESRCLRIDDTWTPDLQAAAALDTSSVRGRLVLPFNWGEYAIWHFAPRLRVSIDGRRETVYSERTIDTQAAAARGLPVGLEYLQRARPEYVWLPTATGAPAAAWLSANGYRVDVETRRSFIATRADLPPLTIRGSMSECFP